MTWNKRQLFCIKPHGIMKRILCIVMAAWFACSVIVMDYQEAKAAEFTAGAIAAGESLEWISTILASTGLAISVKELLKPRQVEIEKDIGKNIDWDNFDWGDMLDSPAAQDQINDAEDMINRLYGNASAKWKEMYEKSLSPTPTPETSPDNPEPSPPVTVAPIDPDTVTPPDWDILKKTSMNNGYLALGAATYWCLKEAVKGFWDNLMESYNEQPYNNQYFNVDSTKIDSSYPLKIGTLYYYWKPGNYAGYLSFYAPENTSYIIYNTSIKNDYQYWHFYDNNDKELGVQQFVRTVYYKKGVVSSESFNGPYFSFPYSCTLDNSNRSAFVINFNLPIYIGSKADDNLDKSIKKPAIWPSTDLKNDYDNNKSPSLPDTSPAPAIKIPSLDEIKDLQKKGDDSDDEKRPSIIQEFVTNHYTNPTPAPEPTTAPDPDPNPTTAPNPDPNPSESPNPTTTPAVNPEISVAPNPSSAPQPSGTPENPDDETIPDNYKPDLRLVFPFCIPFDLIHLLNVFDAEPVAPVFSFPFDLSLKNPFKKGEMILDVHETFKFDFSNLDSVIEIFRITETIGFVIGLMIITRNLIRG